MHIVFVFYLDYSDLSVSKGDFVRNLTKLYFTITQNSRALIGYFLLSIRGQTHELRQRARIFKLSPKW